MCKRHKFRFLLDFNHTVNQYTVAEGGNWMEMGKVRRLGLHKYTNDELKHKYSHYLHAHQGTIYHYTSSLISALGKQNCSHAYNMNKISMHFLKTVFSWSLLIQYGVTCLKDLNTLALCGSSKREVFVEFVCRKQRNSRYWMYI